MQRMEDAKVARLREWLTSFVAKFREEYEKLTDFEKKQVSNSDDYRAPCQLEVFWMKEPEFQLLVTTHSSERSDLEIIINGPYEAHRFLDEIEKIMEEPRWKEIPPIREPFFVAEENKLTYADFFASILRSKIEQIKNSIFSKIEGPSLSNGTILGSTGWVWMFYGNMSELDYITITDRIIKDIRGRAKAIRERPKEQKPPPPKLKGCGVYFYPPIWVGEFPKLTFRQRLRGDYLFPWLKYKKEFDYSFGKYKLILNTDGFLSLNVERKETATAVFNTIMGTALMLGIQAFVVRESEIADVDIDPSSMTVGGRSMPLTTMRTMLSEQMFPGRFFLPYLRKSVSKEKLLEIIRKAERIFEHKDKVEQLRFLLEANTHFVNSEYAQSFTMSWIIIEKYIFALWEQFLKQRKVGGKRKDKLINPALWSVDDIIETLNLNGILNENEYKLLNELKKKRNNFIHKGKTISKEDATQCIDLGFNIVKISLSQYL